MDRSVTTSSEIPSKLVDHGQKTTDFQVPTLNWEEKEYPQIIFWGTTKVSESPVIATLEDSDIDIIQPLDLPSFLCHSKTVERAVKLVTEASHTVYGEKRRHALIMVRQASRRVQFCSAR